MASVAEIAEALADQLAQVTGLRATDYVPESLNPPAAFVNVTEIAEGTFGYETVTVNLDLVVLVSRASARSGQGTLYEYMDPRGPKSVTAAVMSLGRDDIQVESCKYRSLGIEEIAAYGYIGGAFETVVTA